MRFIKLDGLRGIFSLMIVLYHYLQEFLPIYFYRFFIIRESYAFVDFFFVLSGFVISHNYNQIGSREQFFTYVKKRFIRLYPLLFYTVMIYFLFRLLTLNLFPDVIDSSVSFDAMLIKTLDALLFTNSTVILGGENGGMNSPSWSISAEMITYILFGLVVGLTGEKKIVKSVIFGLVIGFASIILIYEGSLFKMSDYGYLRSFISFLMGYFVWKLNPKKIKIKKNLELLFPLIIILMLYFLHNYKNTDLKFYFEFLVPPVFAMFIYFLLVSKGLLTSMLESKPIQYLGKISYSIYLNHFLILMILPKASFILLKLENSNTNQLLILIFTMILIIIYSHVTHQIIELRGGRFLKRILLKS